MKSIALIMAIACLSVFANERRKEKKEAKELKKAARQRSCPMLQGHYTNCQLIETYIEWPEGTDEELRTNFEETFLEPIKEAIENNNDVGHYSEHFYPTYKDEVFSFESSGNEVYTIVKKQKAITSAEAPEKQSICEKDPQTNKKQLSLIYQNEVLENYKLPSSRSFQIDRNGSAIQTVVTPAVLFLKASDGNEVFPVFVEGLEDNVYVKTQLICFPKEAL